MWTTTEKRSAYVTWAWSFVLASVLILAASSITMAQQDPSTQPPSASSNSDLSTSLFHHFRGALFLVAHNPEAHPARGHSV